MPDTSDADRRRYENVGNPTFPHPATDLLLIRHGQSAPYVEGDEFDLIDGHADPHLSDLGHEQAAALAERLAASGIRAIYTSNLTRTKQTAAPLATRLGLAPAVVADLREVHLGEWEGGKYRIMSSQRHPDFVDHIRSGRWSAIPGAEDDVAFRARVDRALDGIVEKHPAERVAVVTHGGVIAAVLARTYQTERSVTMGVDQTSITQVVALGEGVLVVRRSNDTLHLGDPIATSVIER